MKTRTVIIEDNIVARITLEYYCDNIPKIEVVESFDTMKESAEYIKNNIVDLIFLDIELKDGLSWEILKEIPPGTKVVVTTSYEKYAQDALQHPGVSHALVKPIFIDAFLTTMRMLELN